MEQLDQIVRTIALTMGLGWASGINLYAAILMLGLLGATGNMTLPPDLEILANPVVLFAAGLMYITEFVADKIPGVDTGWDTLHTFIRIPAGAVLAMGAVGEVNPAISLAAAILGGGMAAASHATKSGTRVLINASPEPVTNSVASLTEDAVVIGGLWAAMNYPWVFIALLALFILMMIWFLPKLWRGIKRIFGFIGRVLGSGKKEQPLQIEGPGSDAESPVPSDAGEQDVEEQLKRLQDLFQKELITEDEYRDMKAELLKEF